LPSASRSDKGSRLLSQALQREAARHGSDMADRHVPDHSSQPSAMATREKSGLPGTCLKPDPRPSPSQSGVRGEIQGGSVKMFALCHTSLSMSSHSTNIHCTGSVDSGKNYLKADKIPHPYAASCSGTPQLAIVFQAQRRTGRGQQRCCSL
jgi:hypothetical protein